MITLNSFGAAFGEPDASPFCVKAMCLLEMSGLAWQNNPGADSRKAPMQKLPVLMEDGRTVPDSDFIRTYLEEHHNAAFDAGLSAVDITRARALSRMVEEHLYFCLVYERWFVDANWQTVKHLFFSEMPAPLKWFVPTMVRKSVLSNLKGQGLGRMSHDDMLRRAEQDIQVIADALPGDAFLFGEKPTSADASVAPMLAAISATKSDAGLTSLVLDNIELMRYLDRVRQAVYPT